MTDQQVERTEYRVVGDRLGGDRDLTIAADCDEGLADTYVFSYSRDGEYANVRKQKRIVGPWEDVDDE